MKPLHLILILAVVFPVACAHVSEMQEGIEALEGKNVVEATALLGEPNQIQPGKDNDSYIWDYQHETEVSKNVRTTSAAATPGQEQEQEQKQAQSSDSQSTQSCYIKLEVDKNKIIKGWYYKGDQQGCGWGHTQWIQKLKDYARLHPKEGK